MFMNIFIFGQNGKTAIGQWTFQPNVTAPVLLEDPKQPHDTIQLPVHGTVLLQKSFGNTIFVVVKKHGLWLSTNHGANWFQANKGIETKAIKTIYKQGSGYLLETVKGEVYAWMFY